MKKIGRSYWRKKIREERSKNSSADREEQSKKVKADLKGWSGAKRAVKDDQIE